MEGKIITSRNFDGRVSNGFLPGKHDLLQNKDLPNQHPMSAITDLEKTFEEKDQITDAKLALKADKAELNIEINRAIAAEKKEKNDREEADATILNKVNQEIGRAKAREDELERKIDSGSEKTEELRKQLNEEITRATNSEQQLSNQINDEVSRATNSEQQLFTHINDESNRAINQEIQLEENLSAEINRALEKEKQLSLELNNESERAINKENELLSNIEAEMERSTEVEQKLASNIEDEKNRAIEQENRLEEELSSEITRAKDTESAINNTLEEEKNRASEIETQLNEKLDNEINRSIEADNNLQSKIESEEARAQEKETTLENLIAEETNRATEQENLKLNKTDISLSDVGTATERASYITLNGVEKKLAQFDDETTKKLQKAADESGIGYKTSEKDIDFNWDGNSEGHVHLSSDTIAEFNYSALINNFEYTPDELLSIEETITMRISGIESKIGIIKPNFIYVGDNKDAFIIFEQDMPIAFYGKAGTYTIAGPDDKLIVPETGLYALNFLFGATEAEFLFNIKTNSISKIKSEFLPEGIGDEFEIELTPEVTEKQLFVYKEDGSQYLNSEWKYSDKIIKLVDGYVLIEDDYLNIHLKEYIEDLTKKYTSDENVILYGTLISGSRFSESIAVISAKTGTYFLNTETEGTLKVVVPEDGVYAIAPFAVYTKEIKKIEHKFIEEAPELTAAIKTNGLGWVADSERTNIFWDGDPGSRPFINTDEEEVKFYQIIDKYVSEDCFYEATFDLFVQIYGQEPQHIETKIIPEAIDKISDSFYLIIIRTSEDEGDDLIIVAKEGSYVIGEGERKLTINVPEDGVYAFRMDFPNELLAYVDSIKNVALESYVHTIDKKFIPKVVSDTVSNAISEEITLKNHDTKVFMTQTSSIDITLPAPELGVDYSTSVIFKAGENFNLVEHAPEGYNIVYGADITWKAGNIYKLVYDCLWIAGVISVSVYETTI